MKNLEYLLKEINILNKRILDRRQNEEQFNVFDIMLNRFDEVKLHSRFISVLLDPKGTHKKRNAFLKLFIQTLGLKFEYDLSSLEIYPNEADRSEYREIDILLIDYQKRAAVILENKINAPDSNHENEGQLERYYRIITQGDYHIPEDRTEVIYLSINRDGPSDKSVNTSRKFPKLKEKVINIHYDEIISWLEKCARVCYDQPKLRETIIQYIQLLKIMTNNITSENEVEKLAEIIGKNEDNLISARLFVDNLKGLQEFLIGEFWRLLSDELKAKGYIIRQEIDKSDIHNFVHRERSRPDLDLKISLKETVCNFIVSASYGCNICIGVWAGYVKKEEKNKAINFRKKYESELGLEHNDDWPFWKDVIFEGNQGMVLSNMSNELTFSLISDDNRKKIIDEILKQIDIIIKKYDEYLMNINNSDS